MPKKLTQKFYCRPSLAVARELLGKYLVREINGQRLAGKIVETEAYCGFEDKASHASCGLTERNSIMFEKGGFWYVYVVYGIFNCLNITTEKKGFPSAILIRALEPMEGIDLMKENRGIERCHSEERSDEESRRIQRKMATAVIRRDCRVARSLRLLAPRNDKRGLYSGPGKLCQAMKIDRGLNKTKSFGRDCRLWIENGEIVRSSQIIASQRIGVDYAGQWAKKKWRFCIKNNQFVSK
jgi:DNA-3-methyladenine glycosylase